MDSKIPIFSYLPRSIIKPHSPFILLDGHVYHPIHKISNFQNQIGFTQDIANLNVELQEFIWEKHIKDYAEPCISCFQLGVLEYLVRNSFDFWVDYGYQYEEWRLHHQNLKSQNLLKCCGCNDESIARRIQIKDKTLK